MTALAQEIKSALPQLRGRLRADADLAKVNWFRVGGKADMLFKPEDADDLAYFLTHKPRALPVTVLGVGSNLLVRDGGIEGVTIRLGRGFADCRVEDDRVFAGAGCLNSHAVSMAQAHGLGGLEFLSGVPGTVGGALAMNAGAYGMETKDVLIEAEAVDPQGRVAIIPVEKMRYGYRRSGLGEGWVFTRAVLQGKKENTEVVGARMEKIAAERANTQPVRARTGGSTFKNPKELKAWRLIDAAGCRGLAIGGAQMSEIHCNFMINTGGATSEDLERLGEAVRTRVRDHSGIDLEWEIKRIGKPLIAEPERAVA